MTDTTGRMTRREAFEVFDAALDLVGERARVTISTGGVEYIGVIEDAILNFNPASVDVMLVVSWGPLTIHNVDSVKLAVTPKQKDALVDALLDAGWSPTGSTPRVSEIDAAYDALRKSGWGPTRG